MALSVNKKLQLLRSTFEIYHINGFIIPTSDPHLSEYTTPYWKIREWISGFSGSAGTIVILKNKAGLWTDSRYFIQAQRQLTGSDIVLFKEKIPGTPSIQDFIIDNLSERENIGLDRRLFSAAEIKKYESTLNKKHIHIINCTSLFEQIWINRPPLPDSKVYIYDILYAGQSSLSKINKIRQELVNEQVEGILISALDEIAWTLNIRANDIHCNSIPMSFLLITKNDIRFYIPFSKITEKVNKYLSQLGVKIYSYEEIYSQIKTLTESTILVDPNKTNDALYCNLGEKAVDGKSPIELLKAIRNEQEINGIHAAMKRDGVAMVQFIKWLKTAVKSRTETELSVEKRLHDIRASKSLYMGESFDTITGYKEHAAIVHYSATPETNTIIQPEGFLLIDSGAQYMDGTTDITRTIILGDLTEEEKIDYTLILKGHIDLALSIFPSGTTGGQLDAFARMPIWHHHKNFLHGTGHGVGHFLSVHEGPQSIRMEQNPIPLLPGMVISNEPGIYIENKYGIRIENLMLVCKDGKGMFGDYLKFETLTLCPIDKEPIIKSMMTPEEINWLNDYHHYVYKKLSPDLSKDEITWLDRATSEI